MGESVAINIVTLGADVAAPAVLTLDNTTTSNPNRLADNAVLTLNGGTFNFNGPAGGAETETIQQISLSGRGLGLNSNLGSGGSAALTAGSLSPVAGTTITFLNPGGNTLGTNSNEFILTAAPNLPTAAFFPTRLSTRRAETTTGPPPTGGARRHELDPTAAGGFLYRPQHSGGYPERRW